MGRDYVEVAVQTSINKLMGKVLDLARVSEMSERAFRQFDLTIKDEFNSMARFLVSDLKQKGIISTKIDGPDSFGNKLTEGEN